MHDLTCISSGLKYICLKLLKIEKKPDNTVQYRCSFGPRDEASNVPFTHKKIYNNKSSVLHVEKQTKFKFHSCEATLKVLWCHE